MGHTISPNSRSSAWLPVGRVFGCALSFGERLVPIARITTQRCVRHPRATSWHFHFAQTSLSLPSAGTLARGPLLGGAAPREVMNKVEFADWGPGDTMAVTLDIGLGDRLEYPIGTPLYETPGPIHQIRVSPDGALVAFQELVGGKSAIAIVDRKKQKRTLVDGLLELNGLAWTAAGNEISVRRQVRRVGLGDRMGSRCRATCA